MFAQLSFFEESTQWELYIPTQGVPVGDWPTYAFAPGRQLPLYSERDRALRKLGYRRTDPDKAWDWLEHGDRRFLASAEVAPR